MTPEPAFARFGRFRGAAQIVIYNWTTYLIGAVGCLGAVALSAARPWPATIRWALLGGSAVAGFWLIASIAASHWVYDRSPLYRWTWIRELFPRVPRRWANLHVGLDESTRQLRGNFPGTRSVVLDLYDPADMTERSIRRARLWTPSRVPAARAAATSLPLADGTLDAAFLLFAAHELRSPAHRLDLFRELRRVLAPGGRLLLVEHRRDLANFLAFGPGVLHFLPSREWRRLAREGGFSSVREFRMTPFVAVTLLEEAA